MTLEDLREEFLFHCRSRRLSPRTVKNYGKQITYLIGYLRNAGVLDIEKVEARHIKAYLVSMEKRHKPNYLNDLLKAFKVWLEYCHEEGYVSENVARNVRNVKKSKVVIRTFSDQELKRLAKFYTGRDYLSMRNRIIMLLLIDTGIRLSELTGLTWDKIHSDYIVIHGKGDKERVVPASPALSKWLIKYRATMASYFEGKAIPPNVVLSRNAIPLTSTMIDKICKEAGKGSNVSKDIRVSAHTFRHTYAQYQLRHGLDLYTLSRLLGHESISVTQTYLQGLRNEEVVSQGAKTSPLSTL